MQASPVNERTPIAHFLAKNVLKVPKTWGEEHWIVNREYCGKKLILRKNRRCSLHAHHAKDEVFYLISGKVLLEIEGAKYTLLPGDFLHVPPHAYHRFTGLEQSTIIEFSSHHEEDDSFRRTVSGHSEPKRYTRQHALLSAFPRQSMLIVGDVMLDRYIRGTVERISPEAPIPIVQASTEHEMLGGAGNSAANVKALGCTPRLLGVVGDDAAGKKIQAFCKKQKIPAQLLIDPARITTQKERIISHDGHQIVRIDREVRSTVSLATQRKMVAAVQRAAKGVSAILLADYAKGTLSSGLFKIILTVARRRKIPLIVDPKPHGDIPLSLLSQATLLTPNVHEAKLLTGTTTIPVESMGSTLSKVGSAAILLTRGSQGVDVYRRGKRTAHFDSLAPKVVDVSGAGDTIAAVASLVLAAGGSLEDAADMGNRAASIVVAKPGTASLTPAELEEAL